MKDRMPRSGRVLPALTVTLVLAGTLAAWGGWSDDGEVATPVPPAAVAAAPVVAVGTAGDAGTVAKEFAFEPSEITVAAGAAQFKMTNEGAVFHTLVMEGVPSFGKLSADKGEVATESLNLPAGTYSFYCDQAGHRSAGMAGTLTIT